ncbi:UNVERIFIED_CONTAM: ATP sulfurylase 1, chloroplastic [Sesamum radiatum]|uniref:ATP sulfurylase 1, chloroplastic n=1 Tax=Sesamum radiatum TaxID=300843 RepID=A0AAW2QHN0_SESRA
MAAMASLYLNTSTQLPHSFPKLPKTHFAPPLNLPRRRVPAPGTRSPTRISASLIDPDGGKLIQLFVNESDKESKLQQASHLPKIKLSKIDLQWVHVLSEGWASPLKGFMRESEFLQTLHFNSLRLENGSVVNMSVPIVLAIDDAQKSRVGSFTSVALVDEKDDMVAILNE